MKAWHESKFKLKFPLEYPMRVPDAMLPNAMWPSAVDASPILFSTYRIEQILNIAHIWNMETVFISLPS